MSNADVTTLLNNRLAQKPKIKKQGTRTLEIQVCKEQRPSREGTGEGWICHTEKSQESYEFHDEARVVSSKVIEVRSLFFDKDNLVSLPELAFLRRKEVRNGGRTAFNSSVSLSISGTSSWSITKSKGVVTTSGGTIQGSVGVPGVGSGSMTFNWSQQISTSTAITESDSRAISRSTTDTLTVNSLSAASFELLVFQSTVEIPFAATVVVDGDLEPNVSGLQKASQLLSEPERTFPFEGVLRLSDMSDEFVRIRDLGPVNASGEQADVQISGAEIVFPSDKVGNYLDGFSRPSGLTRVSYVPIAKQMLSTIAPPDGLRYEILYTTEIVKPTPLCGFNDIGLMNAGRFSVETRQYSNYTNGELLSRWTEEFETFVSCWIP